MRLVLASDTHEQHNALSVPDGDVFIHAGDISYRGDLRAIGAFGKWLQALPHRHKIVIAGNHDWAFQIKPISARRELGDGSHCITYLQDSSVMIDGVSFYGSPWQVWFNDWAFNLRRGPEIAERWAAIPPRVHVLITHGPPRNILDSNGVEPVGDDDLATRVREVRPKVHVFGHIHESSGVLFEDGTTYVNASICDGNYRPVNPVRVIDLLTTDTQNLSGQAKAKLSMFTLADPTAPLVWRDSPNARAAADYVREQQKARSLVEFFAESPFRDVDLAPPRDNQTGRDNERADPT